MKKKYKDHNIIKSLVVNQNEDYRQQPSYWAGSLFEDVTNYSTDSKGKYGEELLFNIIKELTDIPVQWDADCNTANDDGVYDLFWTNDEGEKVRVEVKTSGRTVSNGKPTGWQHENVYFTDNKWDKLAFIDYDRNDIMFVTIVDYNEVVKDDNIDLSIFGKKGHQRKNEEGKAKIDFSMKSISNGIDKGVTFEYDLHKNCDEELELFLLKKLA